MRAYIRHVFDNDNFPGRSRGVHVLVNKGVLRWLFIGTIILGAGAFLWLARNGLYPFLLAMLLAYLLNPAVCYLEQKGIVRIWAILILYLLLFCIIVLLGVKLVPMLLKELENFVKEIPLMTASGQQLLEDIQSHYQNSAIPFSMRIAFDKALISLETEVQAFTTSLVEAIINSVSYFIGIAITPILAFYLLHDWNDLKERLLFMLPSKWRNECILIMKDIDKVLSGIIRGQVVIAVIVGVLISIGLYLLDVRYALLIGILAGMLDVIPYFGAIIGATPAVTLALLDSPWLSVKVGVLFIIIHQLEGAIISPKILGENVGLHPLSVIFFVFLGGELAGLAGMLLGVPVAAIVKVVLCHIYKLIV